MSRSKPGTKPWAIFGVIFVLSGIMSGSKPGTKTCTIFGVIVVHFIEQCWETDRAPR